MDPTDLIPSTTAPGVFNAAGAFLKRIADQGGQVKHIRLPKDEFMLHAGEEVFSSLSPLKNPTIVRLGPGREFYEHDNFIISTVGLDRRLDTRLGIPEELPNTLSAAVSNYGEMRQRPYDVLLELGELGADYGDEGWFVEGIEDFGGMNPHILAGLFGPRDAVDVFPGHRRLTPNYTSELAPPGVNLEEAKRAFWMNALSSMDEIYLPTGTPVADIMSQPRGIIHWDYGFDGPVYAGEMVGEGANAYIGSKQVVQHPDQIMPAESRYEVIQQMRQDAEDYVPFPWDGSQSMPTRILTHIYPNAPALPQGMTFSPRVERARRASESYGRRIAERERLGFEED